MGSRSRVAKCRIRGSKHGANIPLLSGGGFGTQVRPNTVVHSRIRVNSGTIVVVNTMVGVNTRVKPNSVVSVNTILNKHTVINTGYRVNTKAILTNIIRPPSTRPIIVRSSILVNTGTIILRNIHINGNTIINTNTIIAGSITPRAIMVKVPTGGIGSISRIGRSGVRLISSLHGL